VGEIEGLRPAGTFMGVPHATAVTRGQAAILGLPFDCGTHPTRIGCRQGPAAIRKQSGLVRPFYPALSDTNPLKTLDVVDLGDVAVTASQVEPALVAIARAADGIAAAGAKPIGFGGDGLVSLGMLRGASRSYPRLAVLHIDAHTDAYDLAGFNTATTFTRAAEEQLIDVSRSLHLGARGAVFMAGVYGHTRGLGYQLITGDEAADAGMDAVLRHIHETMAGRPVYLCFDMDYFDPSAAPGVATPTWGGASAREGLRLIEGLRGLDIVAADINTISPPHDVGGMSAYLAGQVAMMTLHLMALGRATT
jgi:agmatinase